MFRSGLACWHKQEQVFFTNRKKHVRNTCFLPGCCKKQIRLPHYSKAVTGLLTSSQEGYRGQLTVDVCGRCCVIEEFPLCGGGSTYRINDVDVCGRSCVIEEPPPQRGNSSITQDLPHTSTLTSLAPWRLGGV